MGQEKLRALLQESLAVATGTDAMKPSDLACVVIDTTVQPKAVMFPTEAKLLNRARAAVNRSWGDGRPCSRYSRSRRGYRQTWTPAGRRPDRSAGRVHPCPSPIVNQASAAAPIAGCLRLS